MEAMLIKWKLIFVFVYDVLLVNLSYIIEFISEVPAEKYNELRLCLNNDLAMKFLTNEVNIGNIYLIRANTSLLMYSTIRN